MTHKSTLQLIYFVSVICSLEAQLLEGLYCGKSNCYDVLDVTRNATKNEIAKKYRQMARKYHPDLHRDEESKRAAEEQFKIVANAYEILKDDESRTDYDYMLDNPDEYYAHYYRYYRRRVAPKVDVRIVLFVTISIVSVIQYYSAWQRYESAIKYFATLPKYRNRAVDLAKQEGILENGKKMRRKTKSEQKEELDIIIRKIIEENMDIKGAYAKPSVYDILWVQLITLPYISTKYLYWYMSWIVKHNILKQPFTEDEKLYIIRKFLKMGQHQFEAIDEDKKQEYLHKELWVKEHFQEWHRKEEEQHKKSLAESSKYKQYRRYIKTHGIGRMTFDDS